MHTEQPASPPLRRAPASSWALVTAGRWWQSRATALISQWSPPTSASPDGSGSDRR